MTTPIASSDLLSISVLIFALVATSANQQDGFYFDPSPTDQHVIDGEPLTMRCGVSNSDRIRIHWAYNGRQLMNVSRRFQQGNDLHFLWVKKELDNGTFNCIATNTSTAVSLTSPGARIHVLWLSGHSEVRLIQPSDPDDVREGRDVTLQCEVRGYEEPSVEWFRNKVRLYTNDQLKLKDGLLKIQKVSWQNNGVYSCKSKNLAGVVWSSKDFIVNVPGEHTSEMILDSFRPFLLLNQGDQAYLSCQYPENVQAIVGLSWYHERSKIISSDRKHVHRNGTLILDHVTQDDAGTYKCTATFGPGMTQTFAINLTIAFIDDFIPENIIPKPNSPQVVPEKGLYFARCKAPGGLPTPTVRWLDPNGQERAEKTTHSWQESGVMRLAEMSTSDAGTYTCVAENMAGRRVLTVELAVSVPPKIGTPPQTIHASEGSVGEFKCKVIASPYPITRIGWKFEDVELQSNDKYTINEADGTLLVNDVTTDDSGNYGCVVNTTGQSVIESNHARLYVERQLKFHPPMPTDAYIELDQRSEVMCEVVGKTKPKVIWFRDGREPLPRNVVSSDGRLVFNRVLAGDVGRYTCYASNEQGSINVTINVHVVERPVIKIYPINTTVWEHEPVMLHCVVYGNPTPQVHWLKNNQVTDLDKNRFKILTNGTMHISTAFVEDSSYYTCVASSVGGSSEKQAYLRVLASGEDTTEDPNFPDNSDDGSNKMVVIVVVVVLLAMVTLLVVMVVLCKMKRKRMMMAREGVATNGDPNNKAENGHQTNFPEQVSLMNKDVISSGSGGGGGGGPGSVVVSASKSGGGGSGGDSSETRSHASGVSSQQSNTLNSSLSHKSLDRFCFSRSFLHNIGLLGKGEFGDVVLAKAYNLIPNAAETIVIVKVLASKDENLKAAFYENLEMYSRTTHPCFSKLLAICKDDEPLLGVFEYTDWGILKQYLEASRLNTSGSLLNNVPTSEQKINICLQTAQAMDYLTNHLKLTHRDLATRNVLLSSSFSVKVSDLGLTRDLYANEYHTYQHQLVPLRWMSPEALFENKRDTWSSDVWSFGVYLWEVFTLSNFPMSDKTNDMVVRGLKSGDVELTHPLMCPPEIWILIGRCRSFEPSDRPKFSEIVQLLAGVISDNMV